MDQNALQKIRRVRQRYILYYMLADACLAAAFAVVMALILKMVFNAWLLYTIVLFVVIFGLFMIYRRLWLINNAAVAGFLDATHPELEESSNLLLLQTAGLNLLQRLQVSRISAAMQRIPVSHQQFTRHLQLCSLWLVGALLVAFITTKPNLNWHKALDTGDKQTASAVTREKEIILPQIKSVNIRIGPPGYTRLPAYYQTKFTLATVEGAVARWELITSTSVTAISLLFNGQETLLLKNPGMDKTVWVAKKIISSPGFYQVVINGKRSDFYGVQVIKDAPPLIRIKTPGQYTYIDAGEKPKVDINTLVTDDYGVSDVIINATVAKGNGEGVKFKEQKINFPVAFNKALRGYNLLKTVNLTALGMEPGDELYFYIQATDNHAQSSRTDVYVVSMQDTAKLLSMDGILSGANLKPEYFRSERQIILDAESLIKQKDTLNIEKFRDRSNELGTDQKLLRLRYGKFLGEEAEGNIGDPRLEDKAIDPKDFGNGAKLIDAYTDKHDNSEDAQFFDPTVKAQLKATLTEMWKAELQLRLYKPIDALPFAYKALRLLKDLQQKSRSFVAKTAYNPSPLKMEKRLSGDLTKIINPLDHDDVKPAEDRFVSLKAAAALLQQLTPRVKLNTGNTSVLQAANQQIAAKAALQPGVYLRAASAMRRILEGNQKFFSADVATVESAIQKMLPAAQLLPQSQSPAADMGFSRAYFLKLNRVNR